MEVDSVHAKIEKQQKIQALEVPADYCRIVEEARQGPTPYSCKYVEHQFFKNYEATQLYQSVRPGSKRGDQCLVDVKEFLSVLQGIRRKYHDLQEVKLVLHPNNHHLYDNLPTEP
ncbi:hypothetical protein BaRGS_00009281 [Batillaria attramentaria]|uniref:Uncharacterized protein n=1 Tax=Batillaria attramentaria TaxID=370345 RepID=A0ABD0LL00_9CAEN